MDFFNKLGKKASKTYQATKEKAVNITEELKLKGKICDLKDKIEDLYKDIRKIVYIEVKDGKDVSKEEVTAKCDEISKAKDDIAKIETEILALKNTKKCVECAEELDLGDRFCCKCGKEQPKQETVEVKEEPENVKEAEVIEVNNVENAENTSNENNEEYHEENNAENNEENK